MGTPLPRRLASALSVAVLSVSLAACGDDEPESADSPTSDANETESEGPTEMVLFDDSEVFAFLGATDTGSGYAEVALEGQPDESCEFFVPTGEGEVSLYADAGDNLAANPDRTVGVKVTSGPERSCNEQLTAQLTKFPPSGADVVDEGDEPDPFDDAAVMAHVGARDAGSGYGEIPLAGDETCRFVVLTSADEVSLWADGGDRWRRTRTRPWAARSRPDRRRSARTFQPSCWQTSLADHECRERPLDSVVVSWPTSRTPGLTATASFRREPVPPLRERG